MYLRSAEPRCESLRRSPRPPSWYGVGSLSLPKNRSPLSAIGLELWPLGLKIPPKRHGFRDFMVPWAIKIAAKGSTSLKRLKNANLRIRERSLECTYWHWFSPLHYWTPSLMTLHDICLQVWTRIACLPVDQWQFATNLLILSTTSRDCSFRPCGTLWHIWRLSRDCTCWTSICHLHTWLGDRHDYWLNNTCTTQ